MTTPGSVAAGRSEGSSTDRPLDLGQLGEAEVEDLDAASSGDEEVLGLQVPVDDPFLVRRRQALGDLPRALDRLARRKPAARELRPQRLALEKLLDDVGSALVRADVVDRGDVGVIEDARGLGLLLEAAQAVGVLREGRRQDLDRDLAPEPRVLRPVDLPHPARADRREDLVRAQLRAGRERHGAFSPALSGTLPDVRGANSLPTGGREEVRAAGSGSERADQADGESASGRAERRCRRQVRERARATVNLPIPPAPIGARIS